MARQKGTDLDSARTNTRSEKTKVTDLINIIKFPEKKWVTGRLLGTMHSYAVAWVTSTNKEGKKTKFPVNLPSWDPDTQSFDSTKYDPWYALYESEKDVEKEKKRVQLSVHYYGNLLLRSALRQKPSSMPKPTASERKSGFKEKDSDTWTPWGAFKLPPGVIRKIQELKGLNIVESTKTGASKAYSVAHERFGCDIQIYFDSSKSPGEQYQVQLGKRTKLTEEELAYLKWDTSNLNPDEMTEKEIRDDYENWAKRNKIKLKSKGRSEEDEDEDSDDDDDDAPKSKSKSKSKTTSKSKRQVEEDEDDDDDNEELDDDEDEDDDPPPKSKSKTKTSSKSKRRDEDEEDEDEDDSDSDDDDDDLEEDEDEDDDPPPKSKGKAKTTSKSKGKSSRDADEDEDDADEDEDDDLDEDEEDDDPPPKSKAKGKTSSKSKRQEEEDEDEEDEDESDEDDDLDEDEDEEDDPPPKPKARTSKTTSKSKRK